MTTYRVKVFVFVQAESNLVAEELAKQAVGDPKGFLMDRKDGFPAFVKPVVRPGSAILVKE